MPGHRVRSLISAHPKAAASTWTQGTRPQASRFIHAHEPGSHRAIRAPPRSGSRNAFAANVTSSGVRPARPVHGTAAGRSATLREGRKEASSWQNFAYPPFAFAFASTPNCCL